MGTGARKRGTPWSGVKHHDPVGDVIGAQYESHLDVVADPIAAFSRYEDNLINALEESAGKQTDGKRIALLCRQGYSIQEVADLLKMSLAKVKKKLRTWLNDNTH